jgi:hypothetical protein
MDFQWFAPTVRHAGALPKRGAGRNTTYLLGAPYTFEFEAAFGVTFGPGLVAELAALRIVNLQCRIGVQC